MKKFITLFCFVFAIKCTLGQNTFPSSGNVGIGTSNPQSRLDITNNDVSLRLDPAGGVGEIRVINTAGAYYSARYSAIQHIFNLSEAEAMRITPTGDVGIGTSTPSNEQGWGKVLDVHGEQHAKIMVSSNQVRTGVFSNNAWPMAVGKVGTETAHPLVLMAGYGNDVMTLQTNGNVGVGTTSPDQKLTIKGGGIGFDNNSTDKKLYSPIDGVLEWMTHNAAGEHAFAISHQGDQKIYLNTNGNSFFKGGNVVIGTNAEQRTLVVNGDVLTRKIKVTQTGWADYVFDSSYHLSSLHEVERYIQVNKHLPELPSAAVVEKQGIDLADNQVVLLKKIEELTLYIIQQNKRIEGLEQQMKMMQENKK